MWAVWWTYHYLTFFCFLWLAKDGDKILGKGTSDLTQHGHCCIPILWLLRDHVETLMSKHFCIICKFKENEADAIMQKGLCFKWKEDKRYRLEKCKSNISCSNVGSVGSIGCRASHCPYLKPFEIFHDACRNKDEWLYSFKTSKYFHEPRQTIGVLKELQRSAASTRRGNGKTSITWHSGWFPA